MKAGRTGRISSGYSKLDRHPDVMEAAVFTKQDEQCGGCAFVTLKAESEGAVTADDIIAFCHDHIAYFKRPRTIVFGPLPKTSTGKIQSSC